LNKNLGLSILLVLLFFMLPLFVQPGSALANHFELATGKKVLIVASYHQGYKWVDEIVRTLEHELAGADLTVFYMDTKRNLDGAEEKAREAFSLYSELQPDAVITIDDTAQSYFVVPYLRDKVSTPVIFCGVNDDAARYGFPAGNVTGVLEKKHYRESISFAQIIDPQIRTVGILYRPSPSNITNVAQIEKEKGSYSAEVIAILAVDSIGDVRSALAEYASQVDAFILMNMTGIVDDNNKQMEGHEAIARIVDETGRVTIGASDWEVESGALCGVIKTAEEQGVLAASQLISHWQDKAIADLPVIQNRNGQRYINLKTMNKLQIQLRPEVIIGTRIITGE